MCTAAIYAGQTNTCSAHALVWRSVAPLAIAAMCLKPGRAMATANKATVAGECHDCFESSATQLPETSFTVCFVISNQGIKTT